MKKSMAKEKTPTDLPPRPEVVRPTDTTTMTAGQPSQQPLSTDQILQNVIVTINEYGYQLGTITSTVSQISSALQQISREVAKVMADRQNKPQGVT